MFRPIALASVTCALGAIVLASAALAGQPVAQALNPPPPPWQTCKPLGDGTICEGTVSFSYGPVDTGLACTAGAGSFDVFDSATEHELARRVYDENGNLVRRTRYDRFTAGQLSNAVTGAVLPYTQTQTTTDVLSVPGSLGSATTTLMGEFVVHRPGDGAVLIGAGRVVFASDGTLEFEAGPSGFVDLVAGDPSAVDSICSALGPA